MTGVRNWHTAKKRIFSDQDIDEANNRFYFIVTGSHPLTFSTIKFLEIDIEDWIFDGGFWFTNKWDRDNVELLSKLMNYEYSFTTQTVG